MRLQTFFAIGSTCLFLSACSGNAASVSTLSGATLSGVHLSVSGALSLFQSTVYEAYQAGQNLKQAAQATAEAFNQRVDTVQNGWEKIREGKEMIEGAVKSEE